MRLQVRIVLFVGLISLLPGSLSANMMPPLQGGFDFTGVRIYMADAHGEASRFDDSEFGLSHFAALLDIAGAQLVTVDWREPIPDDADLLIIAGPTRNYAFEQIVWLSGYLEQGGRLLMLMNPNVGNQSGWSSGSDFFMLSSEDYGFRAVDDVVAGDPQGNFQSTESIEATTSPQPASRVTDFTTNSVDSTHPITRDLQGDLAFFEARSLQTSQVVEGDFARPIVFTNFDFYGERDFAAYLNQGSITYDDAVDTKRGALPLILAYDNPSSGSRMVLIGDRDFGTNGGGLQTSPVYSSSFVFPGNARFLLRASAWLLDRNIGEVSFATPAPTATVTITPTITPTPVPSVTPTLTPTATAPICAAAGPELSNLMSPPACV